MILIRKAGHEVKVPFFEEQHRGSQGNAKEDESKTKPAINILI